jgi:4-hydroxybenzoate polyprenyltransferase
MSIFTMSFIRALRPRHWVKNLLVIVAPLGAGMTGVEALFAISLAFLALSAAASATYLINDVRDREQDSQHPSKKLRAVASGELKPRTALVAAALLVVVAVSIGWVINFLVFVGIVVYLVVTTLYSVWLKRVPALDVIILAGLFVLRIVVGALTISVEVSNWLLATSFFVFISLASAKRFIELSLPGLDKSNSLTHGRGYLASDRLVVHIAGLASGLISAMLIGQYVETAEISTGSQLLGLLWLVVPLWVYWIFRLWILVARGRVPHDPVEFVLKDGVSYLVGFFIIVIYLVAR